VHVPVLADEAIEWLCVRPDGVYVDCTAGAGGHAERIARCLAGGRLLALDRDPVAVTLANERLAPLGSATVVHGEFSDLLGILASAGMERVDGVLFDLGVSSMQLDDPGRGFSYQREGPLDMRMNPTRGRTAREYLSSVTMEELMRVLRDYGDVLPARRIAKSIRDRARRGTMETTADLREAVRNALPFVKGTPEETRTVFQAIRMVVNDELRELVSGLAQAIDALAPEGRLVVISFHSGEDRIVKDFLRREGRQRRQFTPDGRLAGVVPPRLRVLTAKPIVPSEDEIRSNPRSASARLRAAERVSSGQEAA
jgi:16S rRNA (cytosine1402-N4)-methyltransferase